MIGGELPAGRCDSLYRAGVGRGVFQPLHQGDREVPRGRDIGDGRAVDRTKEARCEGRDFRRPTGPGAT